MTIDLERLAATVRERCPDVIVRGGPLCATISDGDRWVATVTSDGELRCDARLTPARIAVLRAVLDAVSEQIGGGS